MRVGNFAVLIPEGRESTSGHVAIDHGRQYTLRICNHDYQRACDAEVVVDGKSVGNFRVDAGRTITLERPAHDTGRFTAYHADTSDAHAAGQQTVDRNDLGLIQVRFRPERARVPEPTSVKPLGMRTGGGPRGQSMFAFDPNEQVKGMAPAMTGLSGQSSQQFVEVSPLNYDPAGEVVITIRLVAPGVVNAPRPLTAAPASNPVPRPVG